MTPSPGTGPVERPGARLGAGRWLALGGVVGPVAFVVAWAAGGASVPGYSPVEQPISRLAAAGAATAPLMTAGFVTFGVGMAFYGHALRRHLGGPGWVAATVSGVATLGVAATPLGHSARLDAAHAAFAGLGYVAVSATPLLAARPLRRRGARVLARTGTVAGVAAAAALLLTGAGTATGALQRVGLTTADLWIAGSALAIVGRRLHHQDAGRQRQAPLA